MPPSDASRLPPAVEQTAAPRGVGRDLGGRLLFLGTGTSVGVPVVGCGCGTCTGGDPRDSRTRTSCFFF